MLWIGKINCRIEPLATKVEGSGMLVLASQHGRAHTMEGRMATGARVFCISEVFYYGQYKRRGHGVDITE